MSNYFIDISEHNSIISYNGLLNSNLKGVIMKATEGTTYKDGCVENYYELLKGKIDLGFYHFLRKTSQPETQALNFWNTIKDKTYQILPVLDVESYLGGDELGQQAQEYTQRFIQEFRNLSGQDMIVYSGRCYIEEHFSVDFRKSVSWWVADYSANEPPTINGCDVIAWQYTEDCHSYAFCMGNLDSNILVNEDKFFISEQLPYSENFNHFYSECIKELQHELNFQDYKDKDGNCLIEDGIVGELTLSACPTLRKGAVGNITRWLQSELGITSDSIFGIQTEQKVIEFQENMSLTGDGIVGRKTWRKLLGV